MAVCNGAAVMNLINDFSSPQQMLRGVVDPYVGVSGSTATPSSGVTFDLFRPLPVPSLGLGVVTLAR